jgi:pteridine reductase
LTSTFFLSQSLAATLSKKHGYIINIVDIHAQRPLKNHAIYNIAKAGIEMMTKTLAKELAPDIRVCGVAPGSILWPENAAELNIEQKNKMLDKIPLNKQGNPEDIARVSVSSACASVAELMRIWLSSSAKVCASVPECR